MNKLSFVCFVLVACFVMQNDAALNEAQRTKLYTQVFSSGLECMKDFPLTLDHIKSFRTRTPPEDEVAKCFTLCIYKKLGIMNDKGKFTKEKARKAAKSMFKEGDENLKNIEELLEICSHVNEEKTSDDEKGCDRAKLVFSCFVEHAPKLGLDVDI